MPAKYHRLDPVSLFCDLGEWVLISAGFVLVVFVMLLRVLHGCFGSNKQNCQTFRIKIRVYYTNDHLSKIP